MAALDNLLRRPAFEVDGDPSAWADVVAAACFSGDWERVERRAAAALACAEAPLPPDVAAIADSRANAVRRDRRLLAADDVVAWLAQWGLTAGEWLAHLRLRALAEQPAVRADGAAAIEPHALARATWIEAVTDGTLERAAGQLARERAAWAAQVGDGEPDLAALQRAAAAFAATAATPQRIAAVAERHRLGWTALELREVALADEGAARELVYCVRDDGRDMAEVAAQAGLEVRTARVLVDELAADVAAVLTAARPGEVTGPLATERGQLVIVVDRRVEPAGDDPATAAHAREILVEAALRAEVARRVRWLDPALAGR